MTCHNINNDFMSGNHNVTKDFSKPSRFKEHHSFQFSDISKILTNAIKVSYLVTNSENAIISAPLLKLLNIAK